VDRVVQAPIAAPGQPVDFPVAGGHLNRGGAVIGGEAVPAGEAGHIADIADHGGGDDRADAEDAGEGRPGRPDHEGQLLLRLAQLGIQAAQVGGELGGELAAGPGDRAGRRDLFQDAGGVSFR